MLLSEAPRVVDGEKKCDTPLSSPGPDASYWLFRPPSRNREGGEHVVPHGLRGLLGDRLGWGSKPNVLKDPAARRPCSGLRVRGLRLAPAESSVLGEAMNPLPEVLKEGDCFLPVRP